MFLWQKYNYTLTVINNDLQLQHVLRTFDEIKPKIIAWDTETTGLHVIKDKPFLIGFGFGKNIYVYEPTITRNMFLFDIASRAHVEYFIAHNAKFDYHMMINFGTPVPEKVKIADSLALARLTDYADSLASISLETLGVTLVDAEAKFAGKVIHEHLLRIDKERYKLIKEYVQENVKDTSYTRFRHFYDKKVQFVDHKYNKHFEAVEKLAPKANYEDSYKENPNLMINYLADDILLELEVTNKLLPILDVVDKDRNTWHRENLLARAVGDLERSGMVADVKYLLASRLKISEHIEKKYKELHKLTGLEFTTGQNEYIKKMFSSKYKVGMLRTDTDALEEIVKYYEGNVVKVASLIIELRTLEKWLSTYINGMLNRIYNGKVHTDINNSGTNTGRVSSDMQQQPKEPLSDDEENELFHPRKVFINEDGFTNFYIDFSNMELRVQAYYTLLTSSGDPNMCRAFVPFECYNGVTGLKYDINKDMPQWDSGEWYYEDGRLWSPEDLHASTTALAFPEVSVDDPRYQTYYRDLGKRANFLKNYGGGKNALIHKLKVSEEIADRLNKSYYLAFPKILDYQRWVDKEVLAYGHIGNLFNRQYYFADTTFTYKAYNYLIQGSCADYVKLKEIEISEFLKPYESKMVMPIHDEIVFAIKNGEEHIVPKIKGIMEDATMMMTTIPMVAEVSFTTTNWAEKRKWENA